MKEKPIIGVCPLWDEEKNSYWMLPGYMDGIMEAGGIPVMLPFAEEACIKKLVDMCDGFLITGGQDVSPGIYGETARFDNIDCCPRLDTLETVLLHQALEADKPVLGICRGIQFVNAALGGTLYQDLPREVHSELEHHQKPPYNLPVHEVDIEPGSPLYGLLMQGRIAVNSKHHQAVKKLAPVLEKMAATPDGVIEAVYMPGKRFVWAVQWHPELSYATDENGRKIFQAFIQSI